MGASKSHSIRLLVTGVAILTLVVFGYRTIDRVWAEQSGSSPESGADSRLKQLNDSLVTLNYGNESSGSWGDWGTYWNRIRSAAESPFNDALSAGLTNGGNTDFPQSVGGIEDQSSLPSGSYQADWTVCDSGNNYCNTEDSLAEKRDENTGLIWSKTISSSANWFTANNCVQPSNGAAPQGPDACSTHGDTGCKCVKLTESKTGCEAMGDGSWRLPYQKELLMVYIDGSSQYLSGASANHWSSTTNSGFTQNAWFTTLSSGFTSTTAKTNGRAFRCIR